MSADPNKKIPRTFQCRDSLWQKFEQMARELECSVDYLINDAMKQYARQRGYTNAGAQSGSVVSLPPTSVSAGFGGAAPPPPPPAPAPAPAPSGAPSSGSGAMAMPMGGSGAMHLPSAGSGAMPLPGTRPPGPPPPPAKRSGGFPPAPPPPAARRAPPPPMRSVAPGTSAPPTSRAPVPPPPLPHHHGDSAPAPVAAAPSARTLAIFYQGEMFLVTKDRFIIGRGKQTSDLTIKDPNVSRQHAMIEFLNGQYYIVDMGSTNGVEYNGQRIQRKVINEGDLFRVCDHELRFSFQA